MSWQNHPLVFLLERLRYSLKSGRSGRRSFELDAQLVRTLQGLAEEERRPAPDIAEDLLLSALAQQKASRLLVERWRSLSPRQQQVAALICLDSTNRQIAGRLNISLETVKTHVRNVLYKFAVHSKTELRLLLEGWDFSAWEKTLR
jgi:DNA-binding NarL/FixJ family response regulator